MRTPRDWASASLSIDTFNWPNEGLLDLFHSHCARHGLARERYTAIKANVRDLTAYPELRFVDRHEWLPLVGYAVATLAFVVVAGGIALFWSGLPGLSAPKPPAGHELPGLFLGGIVAALLDEVSGRAHMGDADRPRFMFTGKLEVRYRKNVPIGSPLKIVGKAGRLRPRAAESWAGIYDAESGELLAEADALHINVPEEQFDISRLEELGWKVYPD